MSGLEHVTLANRYFLKKLAGEGGMAQVYKAWDQQRQTDLAIKVIHDPRFFESFRTEADALVKLQHPNIVRLYELGKDDAHAIVFLVMDWVEGQDLKTLLERRNGPLEAGEVSRILDDLHKALAYAHTQGMCHCDIKPANVLLKRSDGQAILSDFGLAQQSRLQRKGGTLPFMAPELIQGGAATPASDIYALGVTLYMLLTCRFPYEFTTPQQLALAHITQSPTPLQTYNQAVPKGMGTVIERALAKDPTRRQGSVTELWMDFSRYATRQPVAPPATSAPNPPPNRTAMLVGIKGENAGSRIPIARQKVTIGRSKSNQLHVGDPSVSRQHAEIHRRDEGFYLRDLESMVGTYLNGQRLGNTAQRLRDGDRIKIGASDTFEFRET